MSAICARLSTGKVGVQRGRKTAGCPSFLPPRRAPQRSRRPQTANPPLRFSEKLPARNGRTRLRQFAHPAGSVQKRSRPVRANTLTQFVCPGFPVQKKGAARQGEHACGSSRAPVSRCRKSGKSRKNFPARKGGKNAHSHAEKTPIRMTELAKPNRTESGRKFLSKKCLTYWLGYANLYTWLAEAY